MSNLIIIYFLLVILMLSLLVLGQKGGHFLNYASKAKYINKFIPHNNLINLGFVDSNFT